MMKMAAGKTAEDGGWAKKERESFEHAIKLCEEEGDLATAKALKERMAAGRNAEILQAPSPGRGFADADKRVRALEKQSAEVEAKTDLFRKELEALDKARAQLV